MKTFFLSLVLIISAAFLAACSAQPTSTGTSTTGEVGITAEQKQGDTTKTGVISQIGDSFYLQEAGQTPAEIESYAVDLSAYVGQTVTVTGQYSGDTLFVGSVE